jgi:hypothetical protein
MATYPDWFHTLVDATASAHFSVREGMMRDETGDDAGQIQTRSMFAYKWQKEETYQSDACTQQVLARKSL